MDIWELTQRGVVAPPDLDGLVDEMIAEGCASSAGHYIGGLDDLVDPDDLDEETKRELLLDPNFQHFFGTVPVGGKAPDPKCRWCRGSRSSVSPRRAAVRCA